MASSNPTDAQRRRLTATTTLRPDRNRQLEILAVVAIYVFVVHYVLKFAAFLMPDDSPSREEMLGLRGATGVMGFSTFDGGGSGSSSLASRRRGGGGGGFNVVSKKSHLNWIPSDDGDRKNVPLFHHSGVSSTRNNRFHSLSASLQAEDAIQITTTKDNSTNSETSQDEEVIQNANNTTTTTTPATAARNFKRQRIPILSYKNTHCIVSKPTSMTMHHNSNTRWGRSKSPVLQTTIHKQLGRKPYLVHRLDHRTSGACVLGFDSKVAGELHGRLRGAGSKKLYVALVRGDLRDRFQLAADSESDSAVAAAAAAGVGGAENGVDMSVNGDGSVVGTAGKMPPVATPERFEGFYSPADQSDLNGSEYRGRITVDLPIKLADDIEKEAQTDFYFLSSIDLEEDDDDATATADDATTTAAAATPKNNGPYTSKSLTLLLCHPKTGRTHQIRRHVRKAFNAPIIGDSEHGDSRVNRFWRTNVGLDRLALHCWYLELPRVSSESAALSSSSTDDDDDDDDDGEANNVNDDDDGSSTSESIQCMAPLTPDFADGLQHEMLRPLWEEATTVEPRLKMEPYDERGGTFGRHYRKRKEEGSGE